MAIVAHCVTYGKDRTTLKSKLAAEKSKAKSSSENVLHLIHVALISLISRAESGRDLGPVDAPADGNR